MNKRYFTKHTTPFGVLTLVSDGNFLTQCLLPNEEFYSTPNEEENELLPIFINAKKYLEDYFRGEMTLVLPPMKPAVSDYTMAVLNEALKIPFGETISYLTLAIRLNKPKHSRSVGNALGKNPLPLFIPCHRIIKSDNTLGGYTGGLDFKIKLLEHEAKVKQTEIL